MEIYEIKDEIIELGGNNVAFTQSLIPNVSKIYGVRIPKLRILAKKIAKDDYRKFLVENPMDSYEMENLQGMVIGYAKDDIGTILSYSKSFIPKIHDWSVCDTFCQTFKIARKYRKDVWDFLMEYKDSHEEFEVRVVAVMLMSHFLEDDYIDDVIGVLNNLYLGKKNDAGDFYYGKMGIAWAVATIMAKYPDKCLSYLTNENNALDDWTFNKSIQKMRESYRVSAEMKATVLGLKRTSEAVKC